MQDKKPVKSKIPKIASFYARVSSMRQESEETIKSQVDEIKKRIKEDGNILPKDNIFIDDGWTGEILERPNLDLMRDAAKLGKFQTLYVYDRGRLSRVFFHQEIILDELRDLEIEFISLRDINAVTPEDQVMQSMQGIFHQYERMKIIERFRRGKLYKARQKIIINGQSLFGYTYIKKSEKESAKIIINEADAEIVRKIFRWVGIEGVSMRGVIERLYREGIFPRKRKKDFWSKGPIVRMLKCKTYFDGIAYYNKSEAVVSKNPINHDKYKKIKRTSRRVRPFEDWIPFQIEPIFDDMSLFDRVQKILEDNKKYASKRRKYDYLLTGKTYCEHGFRRVGDGYSKGQNHYYRSSARIYKFPEKSDCDCRGVNAVILDSLFWKRFEGILTNPDLIKKQAKKWFSQKDEYQKTFSSEIDRINKQINELRIEGMRYARMRGESTIDTSQFEELMMEVKNKKKRFLDQIEEIKHKSNERQDNKIDINALCEEAIRVIKSRESTNQKQIIKDLVDKIIIKKGGDEVETWIHIPINQDHQMGYGAERRDSGVAECGQVDAF